MKKQILCIATLFVFGIGFSQNTFPTGAGTNVGIGTTSPSARLEIKSGTSGISGLKFTDLTSGSANSTANNKALSVDASGNVILVPSVATTTNLYNTSGTLTSNRVITMSTRNLTFTPSTANSQVFINGTTGDMGLGTLTPSVKLDVVGDVKAVKGIFEHGLADGQVFADQAEASRKCKILNLGKLLSTTDGFDARLLRFMDYPVSNLYPTSRVSLAIDDRAYQTRFNFYANQSGEGKLRMYNKTQQEVFSVFEDGSDNVTMLLPKDNSFLGIGTSTFVDGTDIYRLSVDGAIRAHRVRVYTTWADYVFEKNYQLPTLEEVENHIKYKGHLKDIPSAKEVETNGIELGEMNKLLLQKVEELTLYVIELNKELQEVKSQIKKQ